MPILTANKTRWGHFRTVWLRSFFVTLFFVTLASSLFFLDSFRAYQSEVRVLIIGKTPAVAIDQVVENFQELSRNLSFYERVLQANDLIEDDFEGYSKDERKSGWNEMLSVKRSDKSGVLTISARQDSPEKAKRLVEETAKTLFAVGGFYYDISKDIDLRIIDEPIGKTVLAQPVRYVLYSFGSGLALTVIFFTMLSIVPSFFGGRTRKEYESVEFPIGASVPYIDPQKFIPERPSTLSFESSHQEQKERVNPDDSGDVKAVAPRNLPTVSDERMLPGMDIQDLPFQFEDVEEERKTEERMEDLPVMNGILEDTPVKKGEPTVEEYKRRLNELLSGGK